MSGSVPTVAEHHVVEDRAFGFRRLDPMPTSDELSRFYESQYADLIRSGGRAPELRRMLTGGEEGAAERRWLADTLYADILAGVEANVLPSTPRQALDIGAGTGDFVAYLAAAGWRAVGLEPSAEMAQLAAEAGHNVRPETMEEHFASADASEGIGLMTLLNVLEHVPDAVGFTRQAAAHLVVGGLLVIRVPNDFSPLQLAAQRMLGRDPWWVAPPDHVNYFTYASLDRLLAGLGLETVYRQGDFPMELFLLMGENYLDDPQVGQRCHERRRAFELAVPPGERQAWGRALAEAGFGRNCLVIGRKLGP
jgi:SAM-dependent methyltransferase